MPTPLVYLAAYFGAELVFHLLLHNFFYSYLFEDRRCGFWVVHRCLYFGELVIFGVAEVSVIEFCVALELNTHDFRV